MAALQRANCFCGCFVIIVEAGHFFDMIYVASNLKSSFEQDDLIEE